MANPGRFIAQALIYSIAALATGYFASQPKWQQFPNDAAQIKLSFAHGAKRKIACRRFTAKEIAATEASKRRPNDCSRERLPVVVELLVDDQLVYGASLPPTGVARDGPSRTYKKFVVPAGVHRITARLRDSDRKIGYDYENTTSVKLSALQNLAIDFWADQNRFIFK